jgi:hypothetical protein
MPQVEDSSMSEESMKLYLPSNLDASCSTALKMIHHAFNTFRYIVNIRHASPWPLQEQTNLRHV